MGLKFPFYFAAFLAPVLLGWPVTAPVSAQETQQGIKSVKENTSQVSHLNAFVDDLMRIHRHRLNTRNIKHIETVGGYKDMPEHFRDAEYRDANTDRLLSRIRWENKPSGLPEMIEIFFYDKQGRVSVDYMAIYMPGHRNAPFQALINVHGHDDALTAFRQFDAFGDRLFERCKGDFFGDTVDLFLDEMDIPPDPKDVSNELYVACFGLLPVTADKFLDPVSLVPGLKEAKASGSKELTYADLERRIAGAGRDIAASPGNAKLYLKRGRDYLMIRKFPEAIADFTKAIQLNDDLDAAYFGRGMAHGRNRDLDKGIADLSVYIRRNPESSMAYTKRGVRFIWKEDFKNARKDLSMAVSLDDTNAEAHDDLGVVLAQSGELDAALKHFLRARALEPGYQKVHHNLAMVYYLAGDLARALPSVDTSLRLRPQNRSSLLLKGNILEGLGRAAEAEKLREQAEFLSEGNWSERSAVR